MTPARALLPVLALALLLAGCGEREEPSVPLPASGERLAAASRPVALTAYGDGLAYAERGTNRVHVLDAEGHRARGPRHHLRTGEGGIVGLAAGEGDALYASWVDRRGRLRVSRIAPGRIRDIWIGPDTADGSYGGALAVSPEGRVLLGVGDLGAPREVAEPDTPNGKVLALDPAGSADQTPRVVSTGWVDPGALTFDDSGRLWAADRQREEADERLALGSADPPRRQGALPGRFGPSGLIALPSLRFALCGRRTGRLDRFRVKPGGGNVEPEGPISTDCRGGAVRLADGRFVVAGRDALLVVRP
jgi:Glucose / Sorbosone dehydrogenase